jgi:serine/threonine protein kinase
VTQVINDTQLFSSKRLDSLDGLIVCDKFDVYSLGCVLYNMLMDDFLPQPLSPDTKQFKQVLKVYGVEIADLISGLTFSNLVLRYDITQCLSHPVFNLTEILIPKVPSPFGLYIPSILSKIPKKPKLQNNLKSFWINHIC